MTRKNQDIFSETDIIKTTTDNKLCKNNSDSSNDETSSTDLGSDTNSNYTSDESCNLIDDLKSFKSNDCNDKDYKKSVIKNLKIFCKYLYQLLCCLFNFLKKIFIELFKLINKHHYSSSKKHCSSPKKHCSSSKNNETKTLLKCCDNSTSNSSKKIFLKKPKKKL